MKIGQFVEQIKEYFTKNIDFYILDYVSMYQLMKESKSLTMIWFFGGSKQKCCIQKLFRQISRIQPIAWQRFVKLGQILSKTKSLSLKVIKYDTSRVNNNIAFFEDILCIFSFYCIQRNSIKWSDCHSDISSLKNKSCPFTRSELKFAYI